MDIRRLFALLCVLVIQSAAFAEQSLWDTAHLAKAPTVTWIDEKSPVRSLYYAGEPFHGKPTRVFAYYATPGTLAGDPETDSKLPAVVLVHGGGGKAFKEWAQLWAQRGYAAIAMDLSGNGPDMKRLPDGGPDQSDDVKFADVDPADSWTYHAVADVLLAHSLIRTLPGVDAERTAVTGISWGGYLTCIVAGVDHRFKAAVPVYGCGFLADNSVWLDRFAKMTPEAKAKWVKLYDPSSYLADCTTPIFFINGTNDFAYPLDSYMKSYDLVKCEKNIRITVNMPHGHEQGWAPPEIGAFIDQYLTAGVPLPHVVWHPIPDITRARANCTSPKPIKSAILQFTTGTGPINKRAWEESHMFYSRGEIAVVAGQAVKPPDLSNEVVRNSGQFNIDFTPKTTAAFITVTDDRGLTVSSGVLFH